MRAFYHQRNARTPLDLLRQKAHLLEDFLAKNLNSNSFLTISYISVRYKHQIFFQIKCLATEVLSKRTTLRCTSFEELFSEPLLKSFESFCLLLLFLLWIYSNLNIGFNFPLCTYIIQRIFDRMGGDDLDYIHGKLEFYILTTSSVHCVDKFSRQDDWQLLVLRWSSWGIIRCELHSIRLLYSDREKDQFRIKVKPPIHTLDGDIYELFLGKITCGLMTKILKESHPTSIKKWKK